MSDASEVVRLCRESLWFLCTQILGFTDWDKLHDDIERQLNRPSRRKLILIPRDCQKTSMVTKAWAIQNLLKNPDLRILIANQVWDKAREMLYEIKQLLENKSPLPQLFGPFLSDRWREDDIVIRQRSKALSAPSIATTGVGAEQTSTHYDMIFHDDLVGKENYRTPELREKTLEFYRSSISLLEPQGTMVVIGTRWSLDDLYASILENESKYYDVQIRSIVEDGRIIFPKKFSKRWDEERKIFLDDPNGNSMDYIQHLRDSQGELFYGQYMNNPVETGNQKFRKEYFKYYDRIPEGSFSAMTVDFAIGQKLSSDYTAIAVTAMDSQRNLYIKDILRGRWTASQIIENFVSMHRKWNPDVTGAEKDMIQRVLREGLENALMNAGIYIAVQELSHAGKEKNKELRIEALEPLYRMGKVFHPHWMRDGTLEEELMTFPKGRHDDQADCLAAALELLSPGDSAEKDDSPKPGTMRWELERMDHAIKPGDFFWDMRQMEDETA